MDFEKKARRSALLFVGAMIVFTFISANIHVTYGEAVKWLREAMLVSLAIAVVYFVRLGRERK